VQHNVFPFLRACPICGGLPDEHLDALLQLATCERYRAGDILFRRGDVADRFFVLVEGHVALYLGTIDDPANLATIVGPGQTFAEAAICDQTVHPATAEALGPVTVLAIPGGELRKILARRFDLILAILGQMSMRLRMLLRHIADLKMRSAAKRLASYLVDRAGRSASHARVRLPYDKKTLASQLGMQPETLSRAFVSLKCLGVTVSRSDGAVDLGDVRALEAFCERDDEDRGRDDPDSADSAARHL
jgi:CRP-like cAMP-binding protein